MGTSIETIVYNIVESLFKLLNDMSLQFLTLITESAESEASLKPKLQTFFLMFGDTAGKLINFFVDVGWLIFLIGIGLTLFSVIMLGMNGNTQQGVAPIIIRIVLTALMMKVIIVPSISNNVVTDDGVLGLFMDTAEGVYEKIESNFGWNVEDAESSDYGSKPMENGEWTREAGDIGDLFGQGFTEDDVTYIKDKMDDFPHYNSVELWLGGAFLGDNWVDNAEASNNIHEAYEEEYEGVLLKRIVNFAVSGILVIMATIALLRLMISMYHHYVNIIGLYILAPPITAMMVGQATSAIVFKYIQMFGVELALMCFIRLWIALCLFLMEHTPSLILGWSFIIAWEMFGFKIEQMLGKLGFCAAVTGSSMADTMLGCGFAGLQIARAGLGLGKTAGKVGKMGLGAIGKGGAILGTGIGLTLGSDRILGAAQSIGGHRLSSPEDFANARNNSLLNGHGLGHLSNDRMNNMDDLMKNGSLGLLGDTFDSLSDGQKAKYLDHLGNLAGEGNTPMDALSSLTSQGDDSLNAVGGIAWDTGSFDPENGTFSGSILDANGDAIGSINAITDGENTSFECRSDDNGMNFANGKGTTDISEAEFNESQNGRIQNVEFATGINSNMLDGCFNTEKDGKVATFTGLGDGYTQVSGAFTTADGGKEFRPQFVYDANTGNSLNIGQMQYDTKTALKAEIEVAERFRRAGKLGVSAKYNKLNDTMEVSYKHNNGLITETFGTPKGRKVKAGAEILHTQYGGDLVKLGFGPKKGKH
ncbi:MAG: hypothetical protein E7272_07805 [Pseudobutyrivibrio ruminis]|uniref:Uncharacterized protein n=1 Tax=Pseudobutyrivibrio ruminis TaxID=46206 RepID=A0A927U7H3_9FIRM|nr:hypothetical protein [Pseudobutyrivibrio ruminis]